MGRRKRSAGVDEDDKYSTILAAMDEHNARRRDAMRRIEEYNERRKLNQEFDDWNKLM